MQNNHCCHLFGGEHAYCLPGIDGYVGQYDDIENAMQFAQNNKYDWAHIVEITPLGLQVIQVGRWSEALKRLVWQADFSPVKQRDRYIKTFCSVMYSGVLLIGKLSTTRRRGSDTRMGIMANALSLYDDIQLEIGTMATEQQNTSIHLARQIIGQMITCMRRIQLSHRERQEWAKWCSNAQALLDSTKDLNLFSDRWEASL